MKKEKQQEKQPTSKEQKEEAKHSREARADPKPVMGCGSRPKCGSMRGRAKMKMTETATHKSNGGTQGKAGNSSGSINRYH